MYCPRCGSNQSDDLKFCKSCGANLFAVRQAVEMRDTDEKTNWGPNWVQNLVTEAQNRHLQAELDRWKGNAPEIRRYNEIKGGVITGSIGIALTIFLYVFMQGIILGGKVPADTAEILSRLWVAGIIPVFVGIALLVNGLWVSKKQSEIARRSTQTGPLPDKDTNPLALNSGETTEFIPSSFSVTEETTKHLRSSGQKR